MLEALKQKLQDNLIQMADHAYEQELILRRRPYLAWLHRVEGDNADFCLTPECKPTEAEIRTLQTKQGTLVCKIIPIEDFDPIKDFDQNVDIYVFAGRDGGLTDAFWKSCEQFLTMPELVLLYGDEDEVTPQGRRTPWFKPDYAPDTLLSLQYFGASAIRAEVVRNAYKTYITDQTDGITAKKDIGLEDNIHLASKDGEVNYYDLLFRITEQEVKIVHKSEIFYHRYIQQPESETTVEDMDTTIDTEIRGTQEKYNEIKLAAIHRRGWKADMTQNRYGCYEPVYAFDKEMPLVSIIIPSKDQPELLKTCIGSIREKVSYPKLEIIVIDNGSVGQNRLVVAKLREELDFQCFYEPGEFNFSRMCNSGARKATGEYLLFLNDDTTVRSADFIERMVGQCSLPHVGAVGAKLLYPDGVHIQHVGVTNFETGPSHKLLGAEDTVSWYYGRNALTYDMIAVTAACMMVRAETFRAIQGFDESFKIAYNDVDLCFRLLERGYYNVIRNDAELIHHESMSRGNDAMSAEGWERLLKERESLYRKHAQIGSTDPFYNDNLSQEQQPFECRMIEQDGIVLRTMSELTENERKHLTENETLRVQIDYAQIEQNHDLLNTKETYCINGWFYIQGLDNARFTIQLLFKNEQTGAVYSAPVYRMLREDVIAILPDENHIELAGFQTCFHRDSIPEGSYEIGLLAKDKCSRMQLVRYTESFIINTGRSVD